MLRKIVAIFFILSLKVLYAQVSDKEEKVLIGAPVENSPSMNEIIHAFLEVEMEESKLEQEMKEEGRSLSDKLGSDYDGPSKSFKATVEEWMFSLRVNLEELVVLEQMGITDPQWIDERAHRLLTADENPRLREYLGVYPDAFNDFTKKSLVFEQLISARRNQLIPSFNQRIEEFTDRALAQFEAEFHADWKHNFERDWTNEVLVQKDGGEIMGPKSKRKMVERFGSSSPVKNRTHFKRVIDNVRLLKLRKFEKLAEHTAKEKLEGRKPKRKRP